MKENKFYKSNLFVAGLFLLPAVVVSVIYLVAPIPLSGYYSFFNWNGIGKMVYIGWKNWINLLHDNIFWLAVGNNFKLVFISIIVQVPAAIILAVLLTRKIKGTNILKTIYFLPMLISTVAIAVLWRFMYDPNFGLINSFLQAIGLGGLTHGWLGDPHTAFYSAAVPIQWRYIPLYLVIFMAAISGIPKHLYEAADIDGANAVNKFFRITLPLLRPTIINAIVLVIVGSLQYFAMIYALTGGGPNHASELMATYMYQKAFTEMNMSYGSTISLSIFIISFIVSVVFLGISRKNNKNY